MDKTNIKQDLDTDAIPVMPQNPFLSWEALDPALSQLLSQPSDELAQATRPDFMRNSHSPVLWSDDNWDQLETNRSDIFDMSALVEQFVATVSYRPCLLLSLLARPGPGIRARARGWRRRYTSGV